MTPLSQEHFDQTLTTLYKKFDQKMDQQTNELKAYADEQTETLARIVNAGFEGERKYLEEKLDVRERVEQLEQKIERKFAKLEEALHLKL